MDNKIIKEIEESLTSVNEIAKYFMNKSIETKNNNFPDIVSDALKLLNKLNLIYNEISIDYVEDDKNDIYIDSDSGIEIDGFHVPSYEGNFDIGDGYIIRDGRDFVGFRD